MSNLAFFDTNILVYADDSSEPRKQELAKTLFYQHLRASTAVLKTNDLYARKMRRSLNTLQ